MNSGADSGFSAVLLRGRSRFADSAPLADRLSQFVQSGTILLVFLNTLALILSFVDLFQARRMYLFWFVETLSTVFFIVEYGLRSASISGDGRFPGRSRFGSALFTLIDFASVSPFFVALCTPSPESTMLVLQFGWAIRHLKLVRCRKTPLVQESCDALLHEPEQRLVAIRQQLTKGREKDFVRVQHLIDTVSHRSDEASQLHHESHPFQRPLQSAAHRIDSESTPFLSQIDRLEAAILDDVKIKEAAELLVSAYQQSGHVFDTAPETVPVDLAPRNRRVRQKSVPLRRLGRHHFMPLERYSIKVSTNKPPLYVSDLRRDLSAIRSAMTDALRDDDTMEGQVGLDLVIDRLRDLVIPVRLVWDEALFQLEDEHRKRMHFVRIDIERHGHPSFYTVRLWRWFIGCLSATLDIREYLLQLWNAVVLLYRDGVASISFVLRPLLLRWGLIKPPIREMLLALDEARLDSVFERGLPAEYLAHFDFSTLSDEDLFIGFDAELAHIRWAVERWQQKLVSSFVVYGHRGVGKTTLLNMAKRRLFADQPIIHETFRQKITTAEALVEYLATLLQLPPGSTSDNLVPVLLQGPRRAILLDDCHHLFFRAISGFEALRYLAWLIAMTNHHLLWGMSLDKSSYDFLLQEFPRDLMHAHIELDGRSTQELRRLIMTRHNRSGISLHYVQDKRNVKAMRRRMKVLRRQNRFARINPQEALELAFFDDLARASAGNIIVAFFYWLRSIRMENSDLYRIQPFEALDLSLLWESSQEQAFILAALLQHGTLTAVELSRILDTDPIATRLELEILGKLNILQLNAETSTFEVNPVVQKETCDTLRSRNLMVDKKKRVIA